MATIKRPTGSYLNVYEEMHDKYMNNEWFDETRWQNAANRGNLAREVDILQRQNELGNYTDFSNKYHLDRADENVFYAAVSRELYADKDKVNEYTENVYNPETDKYEEKKYNMTEYDWLGHQLQNWVDYDNYMIEREREQEERDNANFIQRGLATAGDIASSVAEGFLDTVDNLSRMLYGTVSATGDAIFNGKDWFESYREATDYRDEPEENAMAFRDTFNINDWSYIRDENGNYVGIGKYLGGAAYTLGQMAPVVISNMVLPGVGLAGSTAGKISMSGYYMSMWSGRMTERFLDPEFASVATADIVLETAAQSASDFIIEMGLRKLTGGSTLDKLMYGVTGKNMNAGAIFRLGKDFASEGFEEMLQDFGAGLISQAMAYKNEAFGKDPITFESLMDSFIIGGLTSILMTGFDIIAGEKVKFGDTKLSKLKSWVFRSDYSTLLDSYNKLLSDKTLTKTERAMYAQSAKNVLNVMTGVFNGIGAERSANALSQLKTLSTRAKNRDMFVFTNDTKMSETLLKQKGIETAYVESVLRSVNKLADDYATRTVKQFVKNDKDVQKLVDADITQIHDFISKADINQIGETEKRSEKRVNLAKKIIKETGKNVAFSNGKNVVETDDTIIIPGNMADTRPDLEVLRTKAENDLITSLTNKLNRRILNKIRDLYRNTLKDKRKVTYTDAIRSLLFDDAFFKQFVQNTTEESYAFVANLKNIYEAAVNKNLTDAIYKKVISGIIDRQKPIIRTFLINQQNADLTQVASIFTADEITEIRKQRWSKDLANRILSSTEYKNLTTADWRILNNRINYLRVEAGIKDMIQSDLHSDSISIRTRALTILDNEYNNAFFTKYNDKVYLTQTSPGNNLFNDFLQQYNLTLLNLRMDNYSSDFVAYMNQYNATANSKYTNPFLFLQDMFARYTQYNYEVAMEGNDVRIIPTQDTSIYSSGSMEYYNDYLGLMKETQYLESGKFVIPSQNYDIQREVIRSITDASKINNTNLAYTTINDIVQKPNNYLTEAIINDILEDFGEVNSYTVFQYMRDYLLDKYETISLARKTNGEVVFVDLTEAYDYLVSSIRNADKNSNTIFEKNVNKGPITITKFVSKELLTPELESYKVEFVNDSSKSAGNHNRYTKTITINGSKNNAFTKYVILHELQHAIQYVNGLAGGMTNRFDVSNTLIADFEKNMPELLVGANDAESKRKRIQWFVYKTASGEIDANMFGDSIVFVQTLIKESNPAFAKIVLPWGTEYTVMVNQMGQSLELPDYDTGEILTLIDKKKYPEFYEAAENLKRADYVTDDVTSFEDYEQLNRNQAINNYVDQALAGQAISDRVRNDVAYAFKNTNLREASLRIMHQEIMPNIPYEEFLNTELPYIRVQNNRNVYESKALSVSIGEAALDRLAAFFTKGTNFTLLVGAIKPKDIVGYISNDLSTLNEALISSEQFRKAKKFDIKATYDGLTVVNESNRNVQTYAEDWSTGKIITDYKLKADMQQIYDRLTESLTEETDSFDGKFSNDPEQRVIIVPNGKAFVGSSETVNHIIYGYGQNLTDAIISLRIGFEGSLNVLLPYQISTKQYQELLPLINQFIEQHAESKIYIIPGESDVVGDISIDKTKPIKSQIDTLIEDNNKAIAANDIRDRPIELLDKGEADVDEINDRIMKQEVRIRRRTSKRGAAKRKYSDRVYINKAESKGTNLQPFAGRHLAKDMRGFIEEASPTRLAPDLWNKIADGTINYYDIDEYFRRNQNIDEYTFSLIRKYFFPDAYFKTNAELVKFTDLDLRYYYALASVLYDQKLETDLMKPLTFDAFMSIYRQIEQKPELKEKLDEKLEHAFDVRRYNGKKFDWAALDIDHNHLRTVAMRLMDGSIDSASHIIAIGRAIAMSYKYGDVWNTADIKKDVSLDDPTKGHKQDDGSSGTRGDIIADVRTSRDMIDQRYDDRVAESTILQKRQEVLFYLSDQYRKKHPELATSSDKKQKAIAKLLIEKINAMSAEEIDSKYKKILMKKDGINLKDQTINDPKYMPVGNIRKNLVSRIKSLATTCKNWMSTTQWKHLPEQYKKYFDADGNLKTEYYAKVDLKSTDGHYLNLEAVRDDLKALSQGLRHNDFTTKKSANAFESARKYKEKYEKEKAKRTANKGSIIKVALTDTRKNITVNNVVRDITITSNIAMPDKLRKILETQFDEYRQSTVKFLADEKDVRQRMVAKKFYEDNAQILASLTSDEVEEIIQFYENTLLIDAKEEIVQRFKAFEIYMLAYFIDEVRTGRWTLDKYYIEQAENLAETIVSGGMRVGAVWRSVLDKVNPHKTVLEAFATRLGIQPDVEDIDNLSEAIKTGDIKKIEKAQQRLAKNTLAKYKKEGGSSKSNKILTFQKAMMLSGPATILRNQLSNIFLMYGNKVADFLGHFTSKIVYKADNFVRVSLKKSSHNYTTEQLDLHKVKVSEETKNFIQTQCIDNGLMAMIEDGLSKYDPRKNVTYTGVEQIVNMAVNGIINDIAYNNVYNHEFMNTIVRTIFKWQSDRHYINKTTKSYLGKLLTVKNVDLTRGMSEEVMEYVAEAYKLAAFDYMHKSNVITELENTFRQRAPKIYAGYKMVFPFIPTAWNWFVESLNWSPVGLVKNIVQLCRLEKTIDKIENDRMKGRQTIDPRLTKYITERNVGKGVIGSFLLGLGMILGAMGRIAVDDDDDKLKVKIGDVYFDISSVFGTSSILVGAELVNPRQGNIGQVLESVFGTLTEDAWFSDIASMFGYGNDSVWDILIEQPTDILGTFVPNFLKSVNKLFYSFDIKYSSGFLGNLEYLAASSIPFLAYAFPKKIDPFTGEVKSRYGLPFIGDFLVDLVNIASPIRVKPNYMSEQERIAIELGLNKQPLKGVYDDIGQVDYTKLNTKYGELNEKALTELINNKVKYTVENEKGERETLYWKQMSETQKKTVVERIMSNNSQYAKIFTWTQAGHKYYGTDAMWQTLKQLGITKNVFKGDKGFVA